MRAKEINKAAFILVATVILTFLLRDLLFRVWQPGTPLFEFFAGVMELWYDPYEARRTGLHVLGMFLFGIYLGTVVIFTCDPRKNFQGLFILLGTVGMVILLAGGDLFLASIDPLYLWNCILFLCGVTIGGIIAGWPHLLNVDRGKGGPNYPLLRYLNSNLDFGLGPLGIPRPKVGWSTFSWIRFPKLYIEEGEDATIDEQFRREVFAEFDQAKRFLSIQLLLLFTVAFVHAADIGELAVQDVLLAFLYFALLTIFMINVTDSYTFVTFGPKDSGKTTFFYAVYQELKNRDARYSAPGIEDEEFKQFLWKANHNREHVNDNGIDAPDFVDSLIGSDIGDGALSLRNIRTDRSLPDWDVYDGWPVNRTSRDDANVIKFDILIGELFPKKVTFKMHDLSGEFHRAIGKKWLEDELREQGDFGLTQEQEELLDELDIGTVEYGYYKEQVDLLEDELQKADAIFVLINFKDFVGPDQAERIAKSNPSESPLGPEELDKIYKQLYKRTSGTIIPVITQADLGFENEYVQRLPLKDGVDPEIIEQEVDFGRPIKNPRLKLTEFLSDDIGKEGLSGDQVFDLLRVSITNKVGRENDIDILKADPERYRNPVTLQDVQTNAAQRGGQQGERITTFPDNIKVESASTLTPEKENGIHMVYIVNQLRPDGPEGASPQPTDVVRNDGGDPMLTVNERPLKGRPKPKIHIDENGHLDLEIVGFDRVADLIVSQQIHYLDEPRALLRKVTRERTQLRQRI